MMNNNSINSGYNPNNAYQIYIPTSTNQQKYIGSTDSTITVNIPTTANLHGYMKPISA